MNSARDVSSPDRPTGIITFVGVLLVLVGAFNIADGLIAMVDSTLLQDEDVLFASIGAWGATVFIMGILKLVVGWAVLKRLRAGQIFGIVLVGLNAFVHLLFIMHFPAWSAIIIALDILIIYVLTVHDSEFQD